MTFRTIHYHSIHPAIDLAGPGLKPVITDVIYTSLAVRSSNVASAVDLLAVDPNLASGVAGPKTQYLALATQTRTMTQHPTVWLAYDNPGPL